MNKLKKLFPIVLSLVILATVFVVAQLPANAAGNLVANKVTGTDPAALSDGQYILTIDAGYAVSYYDNKWLLATAVTVDGDTVPEFDDSIVWTIDFTTSGSTTTATLTDSKGQTVAPSGGNNNGIKVASYSWVVEYNANGGFNFKGAGSDTVTLAANKASDYKFRAYKNTTTSNATSYPSVFSLFKVEEAAAEHVCSDFTVVEGQDATCKEEGIIAHKYCNECDTIYNADGDVITDTKIPVNDNHVIADDAEWKANGDCHWKLCACGDKLELGDHDNIRGQCSICEFYRTGLCEIDGSYYFIEWSGRYLTGKFYVTEESANDLLNGAGWYYADENGRIYNEEIANVGGKALYLVDGQGKNGVFAYDGGLYCADWTGLIRTGKIYITESSSNGMVKAGWYYTDEDGRFYDEELAEFGGKLYYFVNGQGKNGVVEYKGALYCADWTGLIRTGKIYITASSANGIVTEGWYNTDENGAII